MTRELLQQALEALENSADSIENEYRESVDLWSKMPTRAAKLAGLKSLVDEHNEAIRDIKAHLAQPQGEPSQHFPFVPWSKEAEMVDSWASQPERKPMHEGEIQAAWLGQNIDEPMPYTFVLGIRSAERFNGIKEKP